MYKQNGTSKNKCFYNIANQPPKYVNRMGYQPPKFKTKNQVAINDDL